MHQGVQFLELLVRKTYIDIVFSCLSHSSTSSINTVSSSHGPQGPKKATSEPSMPAVRRTRWPAGAAFVPQTPISQFGLTPKSGTPLQVVLQT